MVDVRALDWHAAAKPIGCALRRPTASVDDPLEWPLAQPATLDDAIVGEFGGVAAIAYFRSAAIESFDFRRGEPIVVGERPVHDVQARFRQPLGVGVAILTGWPPRKDLWFEKFVARDRAHANELLDWREGGLRAIDQIHRLLTAGLGEMKIAIDDEGVECSCFGVAGQLLHAEPRTLGWLMYEVAALAGILDRAHQALPASSWTQRIRAAWSELASARGLELDPDLVRARGRAGGRSVVLEIVPRLQQTRVTMEVPLDMIVTMTAREPGPAQGSAVTLLTGNRDFDERFWFEGDPYFAARLVPALQEKLMSIWPASAEQSARRRAIDLTNGRLDVTLAHVIERADELGELLDTLTAIADLLAGQERVAPGTSGPYR